MVISGWCPQGAPLPNANMVASRGCGARKEGDNVAESLRGCRRTRKRVAALTVGRVSSLLREHDGSLNRR